VGDDHVLTRMHNHVTGRHSPCCSLTDFLCKRGSLAQVAAQLRDYEHLVSQGTQEGNLNSPEQSSSEQAEPCKQGQEPEAA
jgi:hypothetical protein